MPSGRTRQTTPPNHTVYLAASAGRQSRSPAGSVDSLSTASPGSVKTPSGNSPYPSATRAGPTLLPRIRKQDQMLDSAGYSETYHKLPRITSTGFPCQLQALNYRPRSLTPTERSHLTPVSFLSSFESSGELIRESSLPGALPPIQEYTLDNFSSSVAQFQGHSRSRSSCSVGGTDPAQFLYQPFQGPQYGTSPRAASYSSVFNEQALHFPGPLNIPATWNSVPLLTPVQHSPLASELDLSSYDQIPELTTLLDYLTTPNPSPPLVKHISQPDRLSDVHFWWDCRNLRPWSEFNFAAMESIPGISKLLRQEVPAPALPQPTNVNTHPETLFALHDMYTALLATKVNAALKAATGTPLAMTTQKPSLQPGAPKQVPDFLGNYPPDYQSPSTMMSDSHIHGASARVVGIVRTYDNWNTGMRTSTPTARISYLRELAHLQCHMRAHSCRYGFILTEIELVCVRMGSTQGVPFFGLLELAEPVQLASHGHDDSTAGPSRYASASSTSSAGSTSGHAPSSSSVHNAPVQRRQRGLTVALALWYLHMLAKDQPLPGQPGWYVDIGMPAACTRQTHLEKDQGMLTQMRPEGREKRDAKRNRGWIMPEDPVSKMELGRRRWTKKMQAAREARLELEDQERELMEQNSSTQTN